MQTVCNAICRIRYSYIWLLDAPRLPTMYSSINMPDYKDAIFLSNVYISTARTVIAKATMDSIMTVFKHRLVISWTNLCIVRTCNITAFKAKKYIHIPSVRVLNMNCLDQGSSSGGLWSRSRTSKEFLGTEQKDIWTKYVLSPGIKFYSTSQEW